MKSGRSMIRQIARQMILTVRRGKNYFDVIANRGDRFECPFCGYRSNRLSIVGSGQQVLIDKDVVGAKIREGGCFKCGSKDRHRLVLVYLKYKLGIFSSDAIIRILHMAPEKSLSKYIQNNSSHEYIGGDLVPERYSYVKNMVKVDLLEIPYENDSFDLIICNHLLEHISQDDLAMQEIRRVLKPGGTAILQVPISLNSETTYEDGTITSPQDRLVAFGQSDHVRIYGRDYPDRLRKAGFEVNVQNISKEFARFGLNPNEDLFMATK